MKILLACFKGHSWLSKLIQWRTNGPYSHVAYVPLTFGHHLYEQSPMGIGPIGIEAWRGVVRLANLSYTHSPKTIYDVVSFQVSDHDGEAFKGWLCARIGRKYDFQAILNFLIDRPVFNDRDGYFCSELIVNGLRFIGLAKDLKTPSCFLSPSELVDYVLKLPNASVEHRDLVIGFDPSKVIVV